MATLKWRNKYELKPGRWVFEPSDESRELGTDICMALRSKWKAPDYFFHLRKGGHVLALQQHVKHAFFARCDIEDFFGKVTRTRVTRCLKQFMSYDRARESAKVSTVKHPADAARWVLPYGFVQSPLLASLALASSRLGSNLDALDADPRFAVSVYVDDIIVSSDDLAALGNAVTELDTAATKSRLSFSANKSQGPGPLITAFNVELRNGDLAITNGRMAEFAAVLGSNASAQQRAGIIGYVASVNSVQAATL